uniref:Uncharacterized protein n=1 Tax=Caenorhabditis japonica TaxID=281687 RepID=A0A8R1DF74_CAEJA
MYVPAQLGLILQSIIAVASLCTTFYFLEKHIKRSSIHRNFKLLLFAHFVRSYLHVIVVLVASVLLVFERAIATCLVQGYENQQSCKTSWSYAGFIIIFPASVILLAYRNADFETPACFALNAPLNTESWPLPLADLVIPIYSGMQMSKMKSVKIGSLNRAISRESSRQLATDTYEKIFKDQWA